MSTVNYWWGFYTTACPRTTQWYHMQWWKYNLGFCQYLWSYYGLGHQLWENAHAELLRVQEHWKIKFIQADNWCFSVMCKLCRAEAIPRLVKRQKINCRPFWWLINRFSNLLRKNAEHLLGMGTNNRLITNQKRTWFSFSIDGIVRWCRRAKKAF